MTQHCRDEDVADQIALLENSEIGKGSGNWLGLGETNGPAAHTVPVAEDSRCRLALSSIAEC